MRVTVTADCIASELCEAICLAVFVIDHNLGRTVVKKQPSLEEEELVRKAADECPAQAIIIEV
jgi:ferredoxin